MEKIVIIGAGGFGREVKFLIDRINSCNKTYELLGFYDDADNLNKYINGLPLLGNVDELLNRNDSVAVALGIGIPETKQKIVNRLKNKNYDFPILIDPSAVIGHDHVNLGQGTIICAGNIITSNIEIGDFVTLNLSCTIGHDTEIKSYSSFMPSVNISGEVFINKAVYVGTGAKLLTN